MAELPEWVFSTNMYLRTTSRGLSYVKKLLEIELHHHLGKRSKNLRRADPNRINSALLTP